MTKLHVPVVLISLIIVSGLVCQIITINSESVFAHRSGCHRYHSCPSDTGSYVCGDLGNDSQCPGSSKKDNDKSSSKNNDKSSSKSNRNGDSSSSKINTANSNPNPTLPTPTLKEGIEISGPITYVVDGDTLDVNNIRIRLALVNTPEVGEAGFDTAKNFVENHCLNKNGEVDIDEGQRQGSFGREIGVVYCGGMNLNQALMSNNLAEIITDFCDVSEFASETWAKSSCLSTTAAEENTSNDGNINTVTTQSNPSILSDSKTYKLVTKWGDSGKGHSQFNHPASIETDQTGQRFYIADVDNNRVQVLDGDGHFITEWGTLGDGNGQFNGPGSIAVDNQNKIVFVADIKNNRIEKFDLNGKYLTQWGTLGMKEGQFDHPGDIALDPEEEILYITDIYNNRIQAFYYDGNFIDQWGTFGSGNGQFNRPAGIAIDPKENLIYVSDTVNDRIQVLDSNGNFIDQWGTFGSGNGQFNRPDGIHFEPSEKSIYVADRKNHRIQIFDTQGTFVNKWQISNSQADDLIKPRDVALDSSGRAYVVDKVNNNIFVYGIGGPTLSTDTVTEEQPSNQQNATNQVLPDNVNSPTRHGKSYFVENFESDPEDPVYVVSHSTKKDKILDPIYKLVGEIKNKSDEEVTFVKIVGTFYDKDGIVIGTDYTYTDPSDIKPGRTAPYSLTIGFGDSIDIKDIGSATYNLEWD
jgi:DNA-binding beta-propeller fold protein YncE/endonuclease YncB( thermonuclease family)